MAPQGKKMPEFKIKFDTMKGGGGQSGQNTQKYPNPIFICLASPYYSFYVVKVVKKVSRQNLTPWRHFSLYTNINVTSWNYEMPGPSWRKSKSKTLQRWMRDTIRKNCAHSTIYAYAPTCSAALSAAAYVLTDRGESTHYLQATPFSSWASSCYRNVQNESRSCYEVVLELRLKVT